MAARIPVYSRQVAPDDRQQIARVSGNDPVGQALQGIGQTAMQGGMRLIDQQLEQQRKEQQDLAAVQVSNVLSQGEVYWNEQATNRQQAWKPGEDLRPKLGEDFDKWVEESKKGLGTPDAQKYFLQHAARMRAGLMTNAFSFQRKALTETVNAQSAQAENADEILVSQQWRDPKAIDAIIARRVEPLLARSDLTEAQKITEAARIKQRMLLARERAYVENDPAGWLRENGGRTQAAAAAGGVTMSAVWSALIQQESGGKQSAVSPKGAIGVAQVMPDTGPEAAALAGVPWDPVRYKNDRAYNEKIGRAYFDKQLADFGDVNKALAAYNGGPGRLRKAIEAAGPGGDWLAKMPAETQNYVKAIMAKASGSPEPSAPAGTLSTETLSRTAGMLDPDKVYALRTAAETRLSQQQSQLKAEGTRLVTDLMTAHKDGKVEAQPLQPEYFDKAFGPEGARLYSEYVQSRDMGRDVESFRAMPVQQIEQVLNAATPTEAGAGYAGADARANVRRQAAISVLTQREKDPVAYVAATSPRVQALQQQVAAAQDPAQRRMLNEQLIDASLAEQQRLGIQNQRILSPGQADRWAAQAMKATRPEDAANLIAALEMEYGQRNFPKVFNELAREGKISGELLIIPNLPSQAARESVSRLARVKETDLAGATNVDQQKIVKAKAQEAVVDLVRTIPFMTDASVGMVGSYEQMIRKMAYEQVAAGKSPGDAVEAARKMLIGHYEFRESVRYPKGIDYRKAERGMEEVLMRQLGDIDIPPDVAGSRKPEDARKAYTDIVKNRPLWHTTDDDTGARLFVVREDGVKMPVTRGGKPLTFTWEQLQAPIDARAAGRPSTAVEATKALGRPVTSYDVDRLAYERLKNAPR